MVMRIGDKDRLRVAKSILRRYSYKPDSTFRLEYDLGKKVFVLFLSVIVPHRDNLHLIPVITPMEVPGLEDCPLDQVQSKLEAAIYDTCEYFENHETHEWLRYDEILIKDMHKNDDTARG